VSVRKWLLCGDAVVLVLLLMFTSNLALDLPAPPHREYWRLAWPLFMGHGVIRIPDLVAHAFLVATVVCAGVLLLWALVVAASKICAGFARRRIREIN
jgi:hypothetical protein